MLFMSIKNIKKKKPEIVRFIIPSQNWLLENLPTAPSEIKKTLNIQ